MKKNFIIEYTVKSLDGLVIKVGTMRAKNRMSSLDAQIKFEQWLKKKYVNFGRLIVHSCEEESQMSQIFGDIFGKNNPYEL